MVCARTPKAAAALTRQITQSQEAYAVLDGRAAPTKYAARTGLHQAVPGRPCRGTGRNTAGTQHPAGLSVQGQPEGPGLPGQPPAQRGAGSRARIPHHRLERNPEPCGHHPPHRADPSDPGAVRLPAASALGRRQIRQPFQGKHCTAECTALFSAPGDRGADGVRIGKAGHGTMERLASAFGRSVHSIFSPSVEHSRALLSGERSYGTTNVQNRRRDL